MKLAKALRLTQYSRMAFVGAGGKSSAVFNLARNFEGDIWVTASTHFAQEQAGWGDRHIVIENDWNRAGTRPAPTGITVFTGPLVENGRTAGVPLDMLDELHHAAGELGVPLLVEADGSRRRPLKAPAGHEPVIPAFANTVVVTAGMSGVGGALGEEWVHRPEIFGRLGGLEIGETVTVGALAKVLGHPQGGLKGIPAGAQKALLLNQAGDAARAGMARKLCAALVDVYHRVVIADLHHEGDGEVSAVHQRMAGVVLAAGGSERLGEPKQLLDWKGEPFVRVAAQTALEARLDPVVVVVGAYRAQVEAALQGIEGIQIVYNPDWDRGQSTSVRAGLAALPAQVGGAVFMMSDQPQVPAELVQSLCEAHAVSLAPVVAPMVDGRRTAPTLFDAAAFEELKAISGDKGGRQVMSRFRVKYVPWLDPAVGMDVDTPEDYRRLLEYLDDRLK